MTILDILMKAAGAPAAALTQFLAAVKAKYPDFATEVDGLNAILNTAIDPANLAALGSAIPGELLNIAQGKLAGTEHPSDLAG